MAERTTCPKCGGPGPRADPAHRCNACDGTGTVAAPLLRTEVSIHGVGRVRLEEPFRVAGPCGTERWMARLVAESADGQSAQVVELFAASREALATPDPPPVRR